MADHASSQQRICIGRLTALCVTWSLLSANQAAAQFPDLFEASGQYLPPVSLEDPPDVDAQITGYDVSLNVPITLGEKSFLIPGAGFHAEAIAYTEHPDNFDQLRTFYAVDLSILFVQLLPKDWSLSVRLAPGLAGDFKTLDTDMLRLSALLMATRGFSEKLVFGPGAIASYAFGQLLPLPAAYLDWRPRPDLQLELFLPAFLNLKYIARNRVELGLRTEVQGNAYAITNPRVTDHWPCTAAPADDPTTPTDERMADPSLCTNNIAYSTASVGVTVGVRLFETVWLQGYVGYTVYRRFEQMTADRSHVQGGLQSLPNSFLARGGITWRIPQGD